MFSSLSSRQIENARNPTVAIAQVYMIKLHNFFCRTLNHQLSIGPAIKKFKTVIDAGNPDEFEEPPPNFRSGRSLNK